ncbi:structure-specific endonuclease subunit SLX4 isoform X2 [Brachyhypopomus gauderio]
MGVSPAELLQALQRQAAEHLSDSTAVQLQQAVGSRSAEGSSLPVRRKARAKAPRMDEDTMVALALSRSLLEQEKERERDREEERQIQAQLLSASTAVATLPLPGLQCRPAAGTRRGKRRRRVPAWPPPLLLAQDPQTALGRIQERVSSLLLHPRPPTPPTPTLSPSTLPMRAHSAPIWLKSALPGGGPQSVCEFYTPELKDFIQPVVGPEGRPSVCSEPTSAPLSLDLGGAERPPTPAGLTPDLGTPGTQALRDLVELAEEGMTLTQYACPDKEAVVEELPLSGFVPETTETTMPPTSTVTSVSVSRLCSDLGGMVNNPQLSDVQLQVDGGEVYFAHSFMLYARCPLLVNMVHNSGFGVREEDLPQAHRVLLGDVPGEAVYAVLQYLYTACCPLTHTLLPHILQLAIRFGLSELQQQCEQYSRPPEDTEEGAWDVCPAEEPPPGPQQSLAETQFLELLQSMWRHEESDDEDLGEAGGAAGEPAEENGDGADREMEEERVDEEELKEIYEFAATQRKSEATSTTATDSDEEEDAGGNGCFRDTRHADAEKEANASCHSHSLREGGDAAAMVTSPLDTPRAQGPHALVLSGSGARASPEELPDGSLDRSYNNLFSQSWGEFVEPSQTPVSPSPHAERSDTPAPRHRPSVNQVNDLSISPPAHGSGETGESSLPVAGVSPGEGGGEGAEQGKRGKLSSNGQSQGHGTIAPLSPSVADGVWSGLSSTGPMSTWSKRSSSEADVGRPEPLQSVTSSRPDLTPSPGPSCNQPELIVLSDSSDDMDLDVTPGKVSPRGGASPLEPPSPLRLNQIPTQIRTEDRVKVGHSPKRRTDESDDHASPHTEHHKSNPSEGGLRGVGLESMLDGSAEVSWLIPATPEPSTRSSSTQTNSSMRRTRLFPKAPPSPSSPMSSAHDISNATCGSIRERGTSRKPDQRSPRRPSSPGVPERSLDSQKPTFLSGPSHPSSPTFPNTSQRDSVKRANPRTHSLSKPCSSTPLHSDTPSRPSDPLGSPLLRGCEVGPLASSGSQSSRGLGSLHLPPSRHSSSQAEGSELWEEACKSPPRWRSQCQKTPVDPASAEMDADVTETGTKEKKREETKDKEEQRGDEEVMTDTENVSDERGTSWALDEPPIAFDDSWGLVGTAGDKSARFSLRLESSGGPDCTPEHTGPSRTTSPPAPSLPEKGDTTSSGSGAPPNHSLPDPEVWDSWEEEEETEDRAALPLSQRVGAVALEKRVAQLKTPVARQKNRARLAPITPMPGFSDMDTPELKIRLNRFGVRPLPKKQMVLKLKEIHQYTHQLMSSESEEEASPLGRPKARRPLVAPGLQHAPLTFKKPTAPPPVSPRKLLVFGDDERDALPGSQDSNTSSTAESDRSNPELCDSDDDSDGVSASQAAVRERDQLAAARSFILSDPHLYGQVLRYRPLSLASLKASLRAAGIRLGTAKLLDFLDSQCITFTTARPAQAAPPRRRARALAPGRAGGRGRKRVAKPAE